MGWSWVNGELYDQEEACRRQSETKWASSVSPGWVSCLRLCTSEDICAALLQIRLPLLSFYSQKNTKVITREMVIIPCWNIWDKQQDLVYSLFYLSIWGLVYAGGWSGCFDSARVLFQDRHLSKVIKEPWPHSKVKKICLPTPLKLNLFFF